MLFHLRDEILENHGERFVCLLVAGFLLVRWSSPVESSGGELDCAFKLFEELKADGKLDLDEIAAWHGVT